jgi:hypothetical protein
LDLVQIPNGRHRSKSYKLLIKPKLFIRISQPFLLILAKTKNKDNQNKIACIYTKYSMKTERLDIEFPMGLYHY